MRGKVSLTTTPSVKQDQLECIKKKNDISDDYNKA